MSETLPPVVERSMIRIGLSWMLYWIGLAVAEAIVIRTHGGGERCG